MAANKAGAAFLCLDPRFPDGHLLSVLQDAKAFALISNTTGAERLKAAGLDSVEVINVDEELVFDMADSNSGHGEPPRAARPDDLAYLIYTSGTTGRPKGVMIEHRSIVNLVLSDVERFGLGSEDRVAQCSSPAYDSSLEETWLAFAVGACLVPLDDMTVRLGPDLVPWLREKGLTVFCPPPTLLRSMGCPDPLEALPDLRFVYVGGEAMPQDLVDLWAPERRLENGYGPTECTVTVLRCRLKAGKPVTIGRPIRGHKAWVLDEGLEEVPHGEEGELCIGGIGLARGYLGRPKLSAEKFPKHPDLGRIYRTGDLVRLDENGDFVFLGRIAQDKQVKLRGYRIELGAVEAMLRECSGVRTAVCRIQKSGNAAQLIAFIIPEGTAEEAGLEAGLRDQVRAELPEYMMPSGFIFLEALPTNNSGKLDDKALSALWKEMRIGAERSSEPRQGAAPLSAEAPASQRIADAMGRILELDHAPSRLESADFFTELGGDSLSAAGLISMLREEGMPQIAVRDLYEARNAEALAKRLDEKEADPKAPSALEQDASRAAFFLRMSSDQRERPSPLACSLFQAVFLGFGLSLLSFTAYLAVFIISPWILSRIELLPLILLAPLAGAGIWLLSVPVALYFVVLLKRILIGQYQPGHKAVWGSFYTQHWIVSRSAGFIPWGLLEGTVFLNAALRRLGAEIGTGVHIYRGVDYREAAWDLLRIGDNASLGQDSSMRSIELIDGHMVLSPVRIGRDATLGVRAGLGQSAELGEGAILDALSWLEDGARIPEGERWSGAPARPAGPAAKRPDVGAGRELSPHVHGLLTIALRLIGGLLSVYPSVLILIFLASYFKIDAASSAAWLDSPNITVLETVIVLGIAVLPLPFSLFTRALILRLAGKVRPGVYSRWGFEAIRIWWKTGAVESAGRWLSGSLLWPHWLRLAGMRIGKGSEISSIIDVVPETIEIGAESFFADGVYLCGPEVHQGTVRVRQSRIGDGTFLGNHSLLPSGNDWPAGLFIGVATAADPERCTEPDSAWFGQPPMALPRRERIELDRSLTHEPDLPRYLTRVFWETLRFALPSVPLLLGLGWFFAVERVISDVTPSPAISALLVVMLTGLVLVSPVLLVLLLKWLLLGRVKPGQHAFWSCWCSRWDFLYMAWNRLARVQLSRLGGSLYLNMILRAFGMRIGRRVALSGDFAQVVDPDMLNFGDESTVTCQFQAHTFEDRVLKIGPLWIRERATVGDNTVLFYGADIGHGAVAAPDGVVMKRERLQENQAYVGNPSRQR